MIPDFGHFILEILPVVLLYGGCLVILLSSLVLTEWILGITLILYRPVIEKPIIYILFLLQAVMLTISIPLSFAGAACWTDCFGFEGIGLIGYKATCIVPFILGLLLIGVIRGKQTFFIKGLTSAYGIIGFIVIGFFDKGLWCIVRLSGNEYLWPSFQLILSIQWLIYFLTLVLLFSYSPAEE